MRYIGLLLIVITSFTAYSQKGENTYEFLNIPTSAKGAGLGGINVSLSDADQVLAVYNPALLLDSISERLSVNYLNYVSDINLGYAQYARKFNCPGIFALGVQYINYGSFDERDATDLHLGVFTAQETAVSLMYAYRFNRLFTVGASFKQVMSAMEKYQSYGILFDLGVKYQAVDGLFSAGLVVRNFGTQITTYTDNNFESMPTDIALGISQKLAHAPFRFSLTLNNLQQPDLSYKMAHTGSDNSLADKTSNLSFGEKALRHAVIGVEFLPSKNFFLMGGYNFMRRAELKIEDYSSWVGFSFGFGIKIDRFNIAYSTTKYHLAGISNHISVSTNLKSFGF